MSRYLASIRLTNVVICLAAIMLSTAIAPTAAQAQSAGPLITLASLSGNYKTPLDSTPDPDGNTIFFTASARSGKSKGVFQVAAKGGPASPLFLGAPFAAPTGIAMSPDGQYAFVADPQAGQLLSLNVAEAKDHTPMPIPGTAGTAPRNLDVAIERDQVTIYFTGKDPVDGQPAVFKISMFGAPKPALVFKGAPLVEPDGVAIAADGSIYVADRTAAGNGFGKVFKISDGSITPLVDKVRTGKPAGIALTKDGSTLLVSALQPDGKSDQVLVVNLATGETASVTDVVGKNRSAGGLHRAHNNNVFSWIDSTAGGGGRVYRVEPR